MTNPYYDNQDAGAKFLSGELARGTDVDAKFDAVEAGFDAAEIAIDDAATAADAAKTAAEAAQTAAEAAQTAAETAQTNAETAETNAESAQTAAEAAQTAAETAQTNAETAETNAEAAEALAQKWAEEAEDVEVDTGLYSAKHWAAKASGIVSDLYTYTTTATSKAIIDRERCAVTASGQTITLPTAAAALECWVSVGNFDDTQINPNGATIMGQSDNRTINTAYATVGLYCDGSDWRAF